MMGLVGFLMHSHQGMLGMASSRMRYEYQEDNMN